MKDFSGLRKFFEGGDLPMNMVQRWRLQLLRYDFTIVHRAVRMMADTNLLSGCNEMAEGYRRAEGSRLIKLTVENNVTRGPRGQTIVVSD